MTDVLEIAKQKMEWIAIDADAVPAEARMSRFQGRDGVIECQIIVRPTRYGSIEQQLDWIWRAYRDALAAAGLTSRSAVFRRFFCSDPANQAPVLEARPFSNPRNPHCPCAVSWVGQAPLPCSKVALWACHIADSAGDLNKTREGGTVTVHRGALKHHWTAGISAPGAASSYHQTRGVFQKYESFLDEHRLRLAEHVVRTWLFVKNVDADYQGLVDARRELFLKRGLTPDTRYIASTGIEGSSADVKARLHMDAYAISGLRQEQIETLEAIDHLCPTHEYGVTFERGSAISYCDRKHIFISGTASINNRGKIVHPGNISRQLDRALDNIEALLAQAGAEMEDMGAFLVYVRDPSDHVIAWERMRGRFGDAPIQVVVGAVCRPGWLIEVEGIATISARHPEFPAF